MIHNSERLLSVGIDIGTSTTQLVISHLTIENTAPLTAIPHFCITAKIPIFISPVYFTPFVDRLHVDASALRKIVATEYDRAGFKPEEIDTGAVIITGESAKKENAEEIIHSLAGYAGDFVTATAGPDLESVIAGKGSGAYQLAKTLGRCVINVDIGGGTANIVVFERERIQSTSCLNIGGRLIEIDPYNHKVRYIAPAAAAILSDLGDPLKVGDPVDKERLMPVVRRMVDILDQVLLAEDLDYLGSRLLMTAPLRLDLREPLIMFSGGVGTYFNTRSEDWFAHGDLGPLLAEALKEARVLKKYLFLPAAETLHATVLGAGTHTLEVSGSTTSFDNHCLPLRNLPVIPLELDCRDRFDKWAEFRLRYPPNETVAYWLPSLPQPNFSEVNVLAQDLLLLLAKFPQDPLIVLTKDDIGKALGQSIRFHTHLPLHLICLDQITVQNGDYIDINKALPGQEAVPLIVKTLVFGQ
ncbi:ethanolamine ammonia-lyase reactivating factor EutA [Desulfosporosinus sp. FKB]|uniref:ethanolamine ammonia-lyase reactivating factor EutA n=1 Tax=Desulfosporosinus sp. FKB TaxID=1969835 RepID=UPI000B4A0542|nr:ethanolamine ammonia-lyase reactivating factor EutA [Desulfosporosinus sp. FKB]